MNKGLCNKSKHYFKNKIIFGHTIKWKFSTPNVVENGYNCGAVECETLSITEILHSTASQLRQSTHYTLRLHRRLFTFNHSVIIVNPK